MSGSATACLYLRQRERENWSHGRPWQDWVRLFNCSSILNITLRAELLSSPKQNRIMHTCPDFMVLVTWVKFLGEKLKVTIPLFREAYHWPFTCRTWLIHTWDGMRRHTHMARCNQQIVSFTYSHVEHYSCMCGAWLIHVKIWLIQDQFWEAPLWPIHMWDIISAYVGCGSFPCATWSTYGQSDQEIAHFKRRMCVCYNELQCVTLCCRVKVIEKPIISRREYVCVAVCCNVP